MKRHYFQISSKTRGNTPGGWGGVWSAFLFLFFFFYIIRSAVVVSEIMEIVCIYICTVTILSKYLNPSYYSWCKNGTLFLSLMQKNTDYYHSTRGPKCNSLLQTVCRYILIVKTTFCASMFFSTRFEINICKANKHLKSSCNFFFFLLSLRVKTNINHIVSERIPFSGLNFGYTQSN